MESAELREVLVADVAVELSALPGSEAAAALTRRLEAGSGSVLEAVPEEERERVRARVEEILLEAGGDARAAVAQRGVERDLTASMKPEASHALAEAGARIRAPLRRLDERRYVGFLPLGEGGMGTVYLALDTELNRRVAFKMIRSDSEGPLDATPRTPGDELMARFLQEAWVTGGLEHPGIVPVYELGTTPSGVPYYTMRLVRGERTLDDAIAEARTLEERLSLLEPFLKVCDAVRYAHSRGVLHRDLKPVNVALGHFGEAVVLDWGLAKVTDRPDLAESRWQSRVDDLRRETELKTLTSALGTPGYMSPEAALGRVAEVDARSDVYSLGAILYRILAGRLPFEVSSFARYVAEVREGVTQVPGAPAGLERICLQALAPRRKERYADAGELAAAVRAWQGESAVEREVRTAEKEAEAAMEGAEGHEGEGLLVQIDRVLALTARVQTLRPGDEGAKALEERARAAREGAIADRERRARRRLLRRAAVAALGAAVVLGVLVGVLLEGRRREAELARGEATSALARETAAREEAARERDAKGRALDVARPLADAKKVRDLLDERDQLWPVHPDRAPTIAVWLGRAKEVLGNREDRKAALARVRERAEPYTEEDRRTDHAGEIDRLSVVRTELAKEEAPPEDETERTVWEEGRAGLGAERKKLEAAIATRGSWRFASAEADERQQTLADLLTELDAMEEAVAEIEARHEAATTLRARSIDDHRTAWDETIAAIASSPKYGGLRIPPQLGLVPLGPDPDSALFEFAHLGSGPAPARDPETGRLVLGDVFAIVLVLIPGGTFRMGAQKEHPDAPNYDPRAEDDESPVHEVTLSPYFLAKHECTQAQWERLTGECPSRYGAGRAVDGKEVTLRNPVEQVSWEDGTRWLARYGLTLPTEAEWEHACRAGTDTPWFPGRKEMTLGRVANIADPPRRANQGPFSWRYSEEVDAAHGCHAPVGSLAPNAFGLHDVHGNVWEWCRDAWGHYPAEAAADPLRGGAELLVQRGGSWLHVATDARCSARAADKPSFSYYLVGVRPSRPVTTK